MKTSNNEKIYFSIVMVIYDWSSYCDDAIYSLIHQKYNNYEIIIVDNSPDDIVSKEVLKFGDKIRYIKSIYNHLSYSLNLGVSISKGEYIVRMDDDDISEFDRLFILQKEIIKRNSPDVIGSNATYIDGNGKELGLSKLKLSNQEIRKELNYRCALIHPSVAIKRKTFVRVGGYLGGLRAQDYDLWLRMALDDDIRFENISKPLIKYRIHSKQTRKSKQSYVDGITCQFRYYLHKPRLLLLLFISLRVIRFRYKYFLSLISWNKNI